MKKYYQRPLRQALAVLTAGVVLGGMVAASAGSVYLMQSNYTAGTLAPYNTGGGVPAQSLMAAPVVTSTNCTFSWYGMKGWSTVQGSTDFGASWINLTNVAATDHFWTTTIPNTLGNLGPSAIFRLSQNNAFVGQSACAGCHPNQYTGWTNTVHSHAIDALLNPDGSLKPFRDPSCIVCHSVGMNQPGGYVFNTNVVTANYTSPMANVGCESCHGPAGWHKASEKDMIRPAVSIDPAICGSCHQDSHHPTYEEYAVTAHAVGIESGVNCGPCHSATLRMAMLNEYKDRLAGNPHGLTIPPVSEITAWTATCATCHDPHSSSLTNQLRNPMYSTNYYTMPSLADGTNNTTFDAFYNPNVQICGQCHNSRGARWDGLAYGVLTTNVYTTNVVSGGFVQQYNYLTNVQVFTNISYSYIYTNGASVGVTNIAYTTNSYRVPYSTNQVWVAGYTSIVTNSTRTAGLTTNVTGYSRPPHHSPQYNILTGNVQEGYLPVTSHSHRGIAKQCVACHMPGYAVNATTNVTGHTFGLNVKGCALAGCHTSYSEEALHKKIEDLHEVETNSITGVVALLNKWAAIKAPALLGATDYNKSLQNSWEFTTIGGLATITNTGPSSSKQLLLPEAIRKARFNLYMVFHDGSMGTHNPTYTKLLLTAAETNVLSQMTDVSAAFKANTLVGDAPLTVQFTNLCATAAGGNWTFGDGGTTNVLNPAYVYNTPGTYSVNFTETGGDTLTRPNYIVVREKPALSLTANQVTGAAPLTVTFTNTSTGVSSVAWYRYTFITTNTATRLDTPSLVVSYTYTNAGTYSVSLRPTVYGGSSGSTVTNVNFITVTNAVP